MDKLKITKEQARHFLLAYQGLGVPFKFHGKPGIYDYIKQTGCIQFDPLNIVGYNHELVLQSRVSDFSPIMLRSLLYEDRTLIDGWDKNMSIYCTEDWPYFKRMRTAAFNNLGNKSQPAVAILPQVRESIREKGPLSSIDLDYDMTVNWSWAPTNIARAALESMYFWGELIIHHKINTRRIYDFASKHINNELFSAPEPNALEEDYHDWYIKRRIGGIGLIWGKSGDAWLGMSSIKSKERLSALTRLVNKGEIIEIFIEGIEHTFYIKSEYLALMEKILKSDTILTRASILAPLDNFLWDRKLIKELFNFEYVWEVYKPVSERLYGYYVLPILYGDKFVARFEPGWDKNTNSLIIKNWWWEPGIKQTKKLQSELVKCFMNFTKYLDADFTKICNEAKEKEALNWLIS